MKNEELEATGKEWLKVVALAKKEQIVEEHDHVRFRDTDLSIKGGAILGFAGLMLAADLVFLSAGNDSLLAFERTCGHVGFAALFCLVGGAFCALVSILISRKGTYTSAWASFGLMKLYHDRRKRWLDTSGLLTIVGTAIYLAAMAGLVYVGQCVP